MPAHDPYAPTDQPDQPQPEAAVPPAEPAPQAPTPDLAPPEVESAASEGLPGPQGDVLDGTVDEVVAYATDHPDEVDRLIQREGRGKNRSTLIDRLGKLPG